MEKHLKIGKKAVFEKISIGKQWKGEKSAKSESGERASIMCGVLIPAGLRVLVCASRKPAKTALMDILPQWRTQAHGRKSRFR